jgi:hypothetical protein
LLGSQLNSLEGTERGGETVHRHLRIRVE